MDATYEAYRKSLIRLVLAISMETGLDKGDQYLLLHLLDSTEKISMFKQWLRGRMENEQLQATDVEICRAAVQISKGMEPAM